MQATVVIIAVGREASLIFLLFIRNLTFFSFIPSGTSPCLWSILTRVSRNRMYSICSIRSSFIKKQNLEYYIWIFPFPFMYLSLCFSISLFPLSSSLPSIDLAVTYADSILLLPVFNMVFIYMMWGLTFISTSFWALPAYFFIFLCCLLIYSTNLCISA